MIIAEEAGQNDFYESVESSLEDDEISSEEAGFMIGFLREEYE